MKLWKSMLGVASGAAVVAVACDRREPITKETPRERTVQTTQDAKPLVEPTLDLEPSADDVSITEAAGLAVANKASFPEVKGEVKGTEPAPRGTMPKEVER